MQLFANMNESPALSLLRFPCNLPYYFCRYGTIPAFGMLPRSVENGKFHLRSQESEFSHACLVLHYDMHIGSKLNGRIFKRLLISDLKITRLFEFSNLLLTEVARHPGRLLVSELQSIQTSRVHNLANLILSDF